MNGQQIIESIRASLREISNLRRWCLKHHALGQYSLFNRIKNHAPKQLSHKVTCDLCRLLNLDMNTGQPLAHDRTTATLPQDRELLFREHPATVPRPYEPTQSPGFPIADPPMPNMLVLEAFNRPDPEAQNLVRALIARLGAATRTQEPRSKYRTPGTKEP